MTVCSPCTLEMLLILSPTQFSVCFPHVCCLQVRYNEAEPLPFDAVLVDEASMLDVQVGPGGESGKGSLRNRWRC